MGEEKEKEKVKIDVNNPADLKKLREMLAKRGARAVNRGRQKALNTAVLIATPIGLGATIGTAFAYPFATILGLGSSYLGSVIGKTVAPEKYEREGEVIGSALGGLYSGWVGTNYANLGRYTLDNLNPRGYNWKDIRTWKALGNIFTEPLYKTPPTFFNSRPKWYKGGIPDESRFQNGAIWARIPEEEVQRTLIKKNADGITYRPTREAIEGNQYGSAGVRRDLELHKPETINQAKQEGKIVDRDFLSTVGGEHSDYYLTGETPQGAVWMQKDVQQLNPQWEFTDPIKRLFPEGSMMYNIMHKLGGINISRILGYKPFTYKVGIATTKEGVKPEATIFFDPTNKYIIPE